jgi:hypothetical protein
LALVVPDLDLGKVVDSIAGLADTLAIVGLFQKEKIAFIQSGQAIPEVVSREQESANDGFHFKRFRVSLVFAGITIRKQST